MSCNSNLNQDSNNKIESNNADRINDVIKKASYTEEEILKKAIENKDLDFLLDKKMFYKKQLSSLYDMELEINKFQEKIGKEMRIVQQELFKKCQHDWVQYSEGGYDEPPDFICCICESDYRY